MPSIEWHGQDGETQTEEGKVTVLSKLLFVNGAKKRKLSDLDEPPERGNSGKKVTLRFSDQAWCDVKFEQKKQSEEFLELVLNAMGNQPRKSGDGSRSAKNLWDGAVRTAIARAQSQPFVNPFPANFQGGSKAGQLPQLVVDMCVAWEAADAKRDKTHKEKTVSLEAQRNEEQRLRKMLEDDSLKADFKLREAETSIAALQKTTEFLNKEIAALKKLLAASDRADPSKLQFLEEEITSLRQRLKDGFQTPPRAERPSRHARSSPDDGHPFDMAKAIAEFEASPLKTCSAQERPVLKKRLLLKWHPDKQPSAGHADLSKRVMQELQNLAGWET